MPDKKKSTAKKTAKVAAKPRKAAPKRVEKPKFSSEQWAIIILLIVLASPLLIGIGAGILGLVIGLLAAAFAVVLSVIVVALVLLLVPISLAVETGIWWMRGDVSIFVWMFCVGLSLILLPLVVWFVRWLLKGIWDVVKWFADILKRLMARSRRIK